MGGSLMFNYIYDSLFTWINGNNILLNIISILFLITMIILIIVAIVKLKKTRIFILIIMMLFLVPIFLGGIIEYNRNNLINESIKSNEWIDIGITEINMQDYFLTNPIQEVELNETNPNVFYKHSLDSKTSSLQNSATYLGNNTYQITPNYELGFEGKHLGIALNITTYEIIDTYRLVRVFSNNEIVDNYPYFAWGIWTNGIDGDYVFSKQGSNYALNTYGFIIDYNRIDEFVRPYNNTQIYLFYYIDSLTDDLDYSWDISIQGLVINEIIVPEYLNQSIFYSGLLISEIIIWIVLYYNLKRGGKYSEKKN